MTTATWTTPRAGARRQGRRGGFTLAELIIVISIIVLVAGIALPGIVSIFTAGADAQAYNAFAGQLSAARAMAIQSGTYAGVHVQLGDGTGDPDLAKTCYSVVVAYDAGAAKFQKADGYDPVRMPGTMAFGELSSTFINGSNYQGLDNLPDFTTFTVVFSPQGTLVEQVDGNNVSFDSSSPLFSGTSKLWEHATAEGEPGVTAMTMFDYFELSARTTAADRATYLNEYGQFLPIGRYTGQPLRLR